MIGRVLTAFLEHARCVLRVVVGFGLLLSAGQAAGQLAAPAAAEGFGFTLDFEQGDLRGWRPQGTAFRTQPTFGDNPTARGRGQPSRHQGNYWIGTYEAYQGRANQRPGAVQGDRPTGSLTSPAFTCPGGTLSFLVGGGSGFDTRVELMVVGGIEPSTRARSASGRNTETMRRVVWNLDDLRGREVFIRIVDASPDGWGHINVDDFQFSAGMRRVPPLIGRSLSESREILKESGLSAGSVHYIPGGERPDVVIRHAPGQGAQVAAGTAVNLYLSRGLTRVRVPDVAGRSIQEAEAMLAEAELVVGRRQSAASPEPAGRVLRQRPAAGAEVERGSGVDLVLSSGRVNVPDVIGRTESLARRLIGAAELRAGEIGEIESDAPAGTVIRQEPPPETSVPVGSVVNFWLAVGPAPVRVPGVVGRPLREAVRVLAATDLNIGEQRAVASLEPEGIVIAQDPGPDQEAVRGSPVDLTISSGPVFVPDVTGMQADAARRVLAANRLRSGEAFDQPGNAPAGTILQQDPPAGASVLPGAVVTVWVADGADDADEPTEPVDPLDHGLVTVPKVSGLSPAAAGSVLRSSGLRTGFVESAWSPANPPRTVVDQMPAARSRMPRGSAVDLVVAGWAFWLATGVGGLLVLGAAGYAVGRTLGGGRAVRIPDVDTELHIDRGRFDIDVAGDPIDLEFRVQLIVDDGEQTITAKGKAIKSEQPE